LGRAAGVALDAQGNEYAADSETTIVVRVSPNGALTVVAGNGKAGFSGDGRLGGSRGVNEKVTVVYFYQKGTYELVTVPEYEPADRVVGSILVDYAVIGGSPGIANFPGLTCD